MKNIDRHGLGETMNIPAHRFCVCRNAAPFQAHLVATTHFELAEPAGRSSRRGCPISREWKWEGEPSAGHFVGDKHSQHM